MIVAGEVGKAIRINAGIDLSAAQEIVITISHPSSDATVTKKLTTSAIIIGDLDIEVEIERSDGALIARTFKAQEYVEFSTADTDFPVPGSYRMKLQAEFAGGKIYRSETQYQRVVD